MTEVSTNTSAFSVYIRLLKELRPVWFGFVLAVVGVLIITATEGLIYKYVVPSLFDAGIIERDPYFLARAPFYLIGVFLAHGVGEFLAKYFMGYVGRFVVQTLRKKMLVHLLYLPLSFFKQSTQGQLIAKINYDTEQVATAISDAVLELFKGSLTVFIMFAILFSFSWQITLTIFCFVPLAALNLKIASLRIRKHSHQVQQSVGHLTHVASEIIDAQEVIKGFGGMVYETQRATEATEQNRRREMKVFLASSASIPIMEFIGASAFATIVYLATSEASGITAGQFVGLFGATFALIRPIKQIASVNHVLQKGIAGAQSIFSLLDKPVEVSTGDTVLSSVKGRIDFRHVSYQYPGQAKPALLDVSFSVSPGQTIAFVGHSGGGKTTLCALLPRFYDVINGQILLDGVNIQSLPLGHLRAQIAIVSQHVILFNDTIRNNLTYGLDKLPSEQEIMAAVKAAFAEEFILGLSEELDTRVGENGTLLSGGQRQRLAIARAILKDAPILILDEATSALDSTSERYIQQALGHLMQNRTTLVIAHRLSTIEKADMIVVLEHGQIIEQGDHTNLLAKNEAYAKLYHAQFKATAII